MIKPVGKQAYKFKLPQIMKIHNIFYVSFLKLCNGAYKGNILSLPPINIESKDKYEVEKSSIIRTIMANCNILLSRWIIHT